MKGYAFDATRKKETKHKIVFEEVASNGSDNVAVGGLYVSKWLIDEFEADAKNAGAVDRIRVTLEVVHG